MRLEVPFDEDTQFWDPADMTDATACNGGEDNPTGASAKAEGQSGTIIEESKARESPEDESNGQVIKAN